VLGVIWETRETIACGSICVRLFPGAEFRSIDPDTVVAGDIANAPLADAIPSSSRNLVDLGFGKFDHFSFLIGTFVACLCHAMISFG
jgi:hypothetical protein